MMKGWKHRIYVCLALAMLVYAVPRLSIGEGFTAPSVFGALWICFALLIVAAHLHEILGVDEETKERLRQVKRSAQRRTEQKLYRTKLGRQL